MKLLMKSTSVEMFHLWLPSLLTIPAQSRRQRQRWIVNSCCPLLLNLNSSSCHNILTFGNKSSNECLIQFKKHSMAMWRAAVSWHLLILNLDLTLTIVLASPATLTMSSKTWRVSLAIDCVGTSINAKRAKMAIDASGRLTCSASS
jgi:hypothetical protein